MKYKNVGAKFSLSMLKDTFGPVIASSEFFFLIPATNHIAVASPIHAAGGTAVPDSTDTARNTDSKYVIFLEQLQEVTSHPDWPVENITSGKIYRIPKQDVSQFKYRWYGMMTIKTEERTFRISPDAGFFPKGTRQFLKDNGWLNISG